MRTAVALSVALATAALAVQACGAGDGASNSSLTTADASTDAARVTSLDASPPNDAGADAPVPDVSCDALCAAAMKSCAGAYASLGECLHECSDMDPGAYGDTSDTAGCRQSHADLAATNASECKAAGTFGGGVCGDRCSSFCAELTDRCSGDAAVYSSADECLQECGTRYAFAADAGELTDAGNTLNCRMGWLVQVLAADGGDPTTLCANAGPASQACQ